MSQGSSFSNSTGNGNTKAIYDRHPHSPHLNDHVGFPGSLTAASAEVFPLPTTEFVTQTIPDASALLLHENDVNIEHSTLDWRNSVDVWQLDYGSFSNRSEETQTVAAEPDWLSYLRETPFRALHSPLRHQGCGNTSQFPDLARIYSTYHIHGGNDSDISLDSSITLSLLEELYDFPLMAVAELG